jgi:formylglycine-generating enzyme required for sulfatase activity
MANIQIHEFHIKVRWLFALASGKEPAQLPGDFPKFTLWKDFATALGTTPQHLGNWCPPPLAQRRNAMRDRAPDQPIDRPPLSIARNVARIFGFAPDGGVDDDEVWRTWWAHHWPSFTPCETNGSTHAPASVFKERYIEALTNGTLRFPPQGSLQGSKRELPGSADARPAIEQANDISSLIEQFRAELTTVPRLGNMATFILGLFDRIRDLPDASLWTEMHLDRLRTVQEALEDSFQRDDVGSGDEAIHFGSLALLLHALSVLPPLSQSQNAYVVVVNDELVRFLNEIRSAIGSLAEVELPSAARADVDTLDDYLELVERRVDKRINLKRVDAMADRIRRHRIGALHSIERLIAVLIGKRVDLAPDLAIFRDELDDGSSGPKLVIVPAGTFRMGSTVGEGDDDEYSQHEVTIAVRFAIGVCPVTRGEFAAFVAATNHQMNSGRPSWRDPGFKQDDDHPVVHINWHDAQAYAAWLRKRSGKAYRLLSESEWEYCCRAGTTSAHSTGDTITPAQANFGGNHRGTTSVFKFPPNAWRLRGMHGNVWEWCEDNWHDDYNGNPPTNGSVWRGGSESSRVLRGGSWVSSPRALRSASRYRDLPDGRDDMIGFRIARTL